MLSTKRYGKSGSLGMHSEQRGRVIRSVKQRTSVFERKGEIIVGGRTGGSTRQK
jgi:hypothetical protein